MKMSLFSLGFIKDEMLILLGALSLLMGEVLGVLISEHHRTTHATTVEPLNRVSVRNEESVILIFSITNVTHTPATCHCKGKP